MAKSLDELCVFEIDKYDVCKSTYKDKKYRDGINGNIEAIIIDGKDTIMMSYLASDINTLKDGKVGSYVDLYTIKDGKTKNVELYYFDYIFYKGKSEMYLKDYDGKVHNYEEKYVLSEID